MPGPTTACCAPKPRWGYARDTLGLSQDELRQAQVRFRVGEVTKTDVLRAEVAVEQARRQLVTDHNRLRLAFTTLARAIGVPEPLGVAQPEPVAYSPVPYDRLLDQAYSQRQDFRAQEIGVEIATQRKNLVIARYAPRVNARWDFPRLDAETFAEQDQFWTLFLNFEVPLFDGGARVSWMCWKKTSGWPRPSCASISCARKFRSRSETPC